MNQISPQTYSQILDLEKKLLDLKHIISIPAKTAISLKGILKGVNFTVVEIKQAKKSLFKHSVSK